MAAISILWGNRFSSPTTKLTRTSMLQNYQTCFDQTFLLDQVHGTQGIIVRAIDYPRWIVKPPVGDYLVTNELDVTLGVLTADCLPIIFFDPVQRVVAIAHAGWRGSMAGISQVIVRQMQTIFMVNPPDLQVWFGPSAQTCCYGVNQLFAENLQHDQIALSCLVRRAEQTFFDVSRYNMLCLQSCGVLESNFRLEDQICTICNIDYCSYRRDGEGTALQLSLVTLR